MERRGQSLSPARNLFFLLSFYALVSCCAALENNNNKKIENSYNHNIVNEVVVEVDEFVYSKRGEVFSGLTAASNCGSHTAADGSKFDLSSLTNKDGYFNGTNDVIYIYNFCSTVTGSQYAPVMCPTTPPAYVYLINGTGANQKCFDVADNTVPFSVVDGVNGPGSGVQIVYGSHTGCLTIIRVNCNANIDYVWWRSVAPTPQNCTYIITVQARNGCKLKPTSSGEKGLSGGSIFLIVFFVGMATYLLLGSLIKWKLMGAPVGVDMIPNVELWAQLPGLILDGCKFTKAKLMGLCGGGGYNNI